MGKKKNRKGGDDDDDFTGEVDNAKGYVSLQEVARREAAEADKQGDENTKPSKKNKKKSKQGGDEDNDDNDVIAPKRNKKGAAAKEDDAAFDDAKEEKKGDGEVIGGKAAAKDADSGDAEDDVDIEQQKADHFVGVDSKNTRKKKKQEQKMYGGGDELAGAFDEDAEEDEVHAKKGKQDKKSKKQVEKDEKRAAMKAAKKNKKKQDSDYDDEEPADGDDKNEEGKNEGDDGGVFKDLGKQFGKGAKKKGKKNKGEAEPAKEDPPEEEKVADAGGGDDEGAQKEVEEDQYPLNVIYCAKCTLPPEYCSFGQKDISACKAWLQASHPVLYRDLYGEDGVDAADGKAKTTGTDKEEQKIQGGGEAGAPEESKGDEGAAEQKPQKKKAAKNEGIIHVYKLKRGGKKIQCLMTGWDHYTKDLKALCGKFQKKFSCGASTAQDEQYGACIQVQGDIEERLLDYLEEDKEMIKMEIPIDKVVFEEKGNKKGRKKH